MTMAPWRSALLPVRGSHLVFSLGLFASLFAVFHGSPVRTSYDSRWSVHTAMSFARGHWGNLSEYTPILEQEALYAIEYYRDGPHTSFPVGVSLLATPALAIVSLIDPSFNEALRHALPLELEGLLAAIFGALAGVGFFWIVAVRFNDRALAMLSTLVFCLCTSMWSTATRGLWQHGPLVLVWLVVMVLLRAAQSRPGAIQYLGLPLAMAFIIRLMSAVGILVLSMYVYAFYRRWFLRYLAWSLPLALPWFALNLFVYGFLFPPYYFRTGLRTGLYGVSVLGEALLGNLVSPGRGLFVYSPVLLFAVVGFVISLREREERRLHLALGIMVIAH